MQLAELARCACEGQGLWWRVDEVSDKMITTLVEPRTWVLFLRRGLLTSQVIVKQAGCLRGDERRGETFSLSRWKMEDRVVEGRTMGGG